ncbi:hypothetical protein RKD29_007409 [Streptomyces tendae]
MTALSPMAPIFPLVPQCRQHGELVVDVDQLIALGAESGTGVGAAQIDDRETVGAQAPEIVLDVRPQLLGPLGEPQGKRTAGVGGRADLGHDHGVVRGTQRLAQDLVDEAVAVELGGVEVVDAQLHRAAHQCDGGGAVGVQPLELHRAVPDPGDGAARERARAAGTGSVLGRDGRRGAV